MEESTKNIVRTACAAVGSLKESEFDIRFNPDVYSPGIRHCEEKDPPLSKQRQLVKDAAEFLLTVQIPTFVSSSKTFSRSSLQFSLIVDPRLFRPFFRTNGRTDFVGSDA